ncbi:MAG TPA: hypothetical protein VFA79_19525, partial [Myxococcales bacterium]|nr:hypothetical protein [Myxococcales bacterium]
SLAPLLTQRVSRIEDRCDPALLGEGGEWDLEPLEELVVSRVPNVRELKRPKVVEDVLQMGAILWTKHLRSVSTDAEWEVNELESLGVIAEDDDWQVRAAERRLVVDISGNEVLALIDNGVAPDRLVVGLQRLSVPRSHVFEDILEGG